jgi:hypothetical protein
MSAAVGGLATAAALVTAVTAMGDKSLGGSSALLRCVVDLGELKPRTGVSEGWKGPALEDLDLEFVCRAQSVDELQG